MKWLREIAGHLRFVDSHFGGLPCEIGQTSSIKPMRLHYVINCTRKVDLCYLGIGNRAGELFIASYRRIFRLLKKSCTPCHSRAEAGRHRPLHEPSCALRTVPLAGNYITTAKLSDPRYGFAIPIITKQKSSSSLALAYRYLERPVCRATCRLDQYLILPRSSVSPFLLFTAKVQ